MEKKKENTEEKSNKFAYDSSDGLKKMSKEELLKVFDKKEDETDKPIKKGHEQWL